MCVCAVICTHNGYYTIPCASRPREHMGIPYLNLLRLCAPIANVVWWYMCASNQQQKQATIVHNHWLESWSDHHSKIAHLVCIDGRLDDVKMMENGTRFHLMSTVNNNRIPTGTAPHLLCRDMPSTWVFFSALRSAGHTTRVKRYERP